MRFSALALALIALLALAGAAPAAQFSRTITLHEPLGITWTDELVHRDERIAEPRVAVLTLALVDVDGRPAALQTEILEGKPDAVRRVRLWLKATLPAGKDVTYRLTYNDEGRAANPMNLVGEGALRGGVVVRHEAERVIISNGAIDLAVAAPAKLPQRLVELRKVPAPLLGVRPAGDPAWLGAWALDGTARVKELKTDVTASGPLWAEVRLKYVFEERTYSYDATIRTVRGEPWADIVEKYHLPQGTHATCLFRGPRRPAEALWMPWYVDRDGRRQPAYDLHRLALDDRLPVGDVFATLRPRWTEVPAATQVLLASGLGEGNAAAGAAMVAASEWQRPYEQFPMARVPDGRDGVQLDFPLVDGRRRWLILAGPADRFDSRAKLQHLLRRSADLPLDTVLNEWILQWPRDPAAPAPHVLVTAARLQEIRTDFAAARDTPAVRLIRGVLAGEVPGDRRLAEFLAGKPDALGTVSLSAMPYFDHSYQDPEFSPLGLARELAPRICLADLAAVGRPAGDAQAAALGYIFSDLDYWPGSAGGWDPGNQAFNEVMNSVALAAAAMMPDHPHAKRWAAPALAGLREDLRRATVTAGGAGAEGSTSAASAVASLLPAMRAVQNARLDDPFRWPEVRAAAEFLRNLHTPPDPRLGRRDLAPFGDPAPEACRSLADIGSPRCSAAGQANWNDAVGTLFGMVAAGSREADPNFAAQCVAMYRQYYGTGTGGDLVRDVMLCDFGAVGGPAADTAALLGGGPWVSRAYPGFGAVLRSRFGTDRETFAAFKCSLPAGEGQRGAAGPRGPVHADEMSFQFYGAGMPIAAGWHCARPRLVAEHMFNRVNLGDNENMDAAGELVTVAATPAADVAVGLARSDRLRKMPHLAQDIGQETAFPRRAFLGDLRYRRYVMLVKHDGGAAGGLEDYLVVRDEIVGPEPATFNLFVLARSIREDGRTFWFDGQLAADAVAFFASPDVDKVRFDRWGWPRADDAALVPRDFRAGRDTWRGGELQQWLRVTGSPGEAFLVVLYPYRKDGPVPQFQSLAGGKGVRVSLGGESEEVYLSTDPAPGIGGQAVVRREGQTTVILKPGAAGQ